MKVITFSRFFPAKHPRKSEETEFVWKIWKGLFDEPDDALYSHEVAGMWSAYREVYDSIKAKHHTIRAGNRWEVGDFFSPRVWSGLPYRSKQIEFAPPVEIKKIWNVNIGGERFNKCVSVVHENSKYETLIPLSDVAKNDGLTNDDFISWFPNNFSGQIICWNDKINYV